MLFSELKKITEFGLFRFQCFIIKICNIELTYLNKLIQWYKRYHVSVNLFVNVQKIHYDGLNVLHLVVSFSTCESNGLFKKKIFKL